MSTVDEKSKGLVAEVVEEIVEKTPSKDLGLFVKMIGVAFFIVALGMAISFVTRGMITVSYSKNTKNENTEKMKTVELVPDVSVVKEQLTR